MPERIAVTGANGFVGRHLTRHASASGWEVVGIVRSDAAATVVRQAGGRPVILGGRDPEAFPRALEGARAIVHLAQIGAERDGATYETVNLAGTKKALEGAARAGVGRVVYFSGLGVTRYGLERRCTNGYFLSKLASEVELFRSGREVVVFRPSFVVGPGDAFVAGVLVEMAEGEVERPGDGSYRMQPIAVRDAVAAVLAAIERPLDRPCVFDLVGPEAVSYRQLLERLARVGAAAGRPTEHRIREVSLEEVDRRAAAGGYRGMLADEVDCLLCDEVADPAPLEALLARSLTPLDEALAAAVRAA